MEKYGKWEIIKDLGEGGQGKAYLAKDTAKVGETNQRLMEIKNTISNLALSQPAEVQRRMAQSLVDAISLLTPTTTDPSAVAALKILHKPKDQAGYQKAKDRLKQEVETLTEINHPNILRILDHNLEEGWFVGEYHSRGPLSEHNNLYKGDVLRALTAFKPLVEAVVELHKAKRVHRDIKPHNVFIAADGQLVLGDFGIVLFDDPSRTRVTDTYENVGSRDWMPPWAMGRRIEDTEPSFDVFSLGKLLWAMLSGRNLLPFWYHHKRAYELEDMFHDDESMKWARIILDRCIVENEDECLRSATELLVVVNDVLRAVKRHAQVVGNGIERRCEVCGIGAYSYISDENQPFTRAFGLQPTGSREFKIFTCDHCGHVQLFQIPNPNDKPAAWRK
jgi:serine/threonine protein kinase